MFGCKKWNANEECAVDRLLASCEAAATPDDHVDGDDDSSVFCFLAITMRRVAQLTSPSLWREAKEGHH